MTHNKIRSSSDLQVLAERSQNSKRCASTIGSMKQKRHSLRKRSASNFNTTYEIHTQAPTYDFLKNDTCVLFPEAVKGPYWYPPSQLLTRDMAQDQVGVPLELDIGVIDVSTCEPLDNALISLWHCNATGSYSSFTGRDPNTAFRTLLKQQGVNETEVEEFEDFTWLATDKTTWCRGLWPTDVHGATSFESIFPGFYVGRTIHIHVEVHTNWTVTANGTIDHSKIVETGQIYFDEDVTEKIMGLEPYASHVEIERVTNDEDNIFQSDMVDCEYLDLG
ncbi:hypothetical protein HII31_10703 [Pseudocercospora fuligena]|uniref:Intradiol ring-cleavage dioxygenases domain-containing protein n=1 Tax=Pseudocercospora fuligena TaxID=685502 RepID=A0A8H6RB20_9PEZI|nr:hypothetical protein HII31_10703 [Pseudocercospora fuligena]